MSYDNKNRGSVWKNDRKEKDTDPDFKGNYTDEHGAEYWVSAWKRKPDAKEKAPALTFSLKKKENQQISTQKQEPVKQEPAFDAFDDEIPFANPYKNMEYMV